MSETKKRSCEFCGREGGWHNSDCQHPIVKKLLAGEPVFLEVTKEGETRGLSTCEICEQKKYYDSSRTCEIGLVCADCYPKYKKIKDRLEEYLNKSLRKKLGEIKSWIG